MQSSALSAAPMAEPNCALMSLYTEKRPLAAAARSICAALSLLQERRQILYGQIKFLPRDDAAFHRVNCLKA